MVSADRFAVFFRLLVLGITAIAVGSPTTTSGAPREDHRSEFYPLLLLAASGMTLLVSAGDLMMVFLALELLSLSLYILAGFSVGPAGLPGGRP